MASFEFLLVLSAIALLGSLFLQSRLAQIRARQYVSANITTFHSSQRIQLAPLPPKRAKRPMRFISLDEFRKLLKENPDDLIVLDFRNDARLAGFPVQDACVLPVRPDELQEILAWLPSNQSVVFYGVRTPWISTIERSLSVEGSAPIYFLDSGFSYPEAA
jgi:hypothetical protein